MPADSAPDPTALDYAPSRGQKSRWPITFGVLAIVFGICGALYGSVQIVSTKMMEGAYSELSAIPEADEQTREMYEAMMKSQEKWTSASLLLNGILCLLGLLLLLSGIFLLLRKPVASPLLQTWAYGKIVTSTGATVVGLLQQREMANAMSASISSSLASSGSSSMAGAYSTGMTAVYGLFAIVGILWFAALPIVYLIWLNREIVKADIATWGRNADLQPAEA